MQARILATSLNGVSMLWVREKKARKVIFDMQALWSKSYGKQWAIAHWNTVAIHC